MKRIKLIVCLTLVSAAIATATFTFSSTFSSSSNPLINNIVALASGESSEWRESSTSGTVNIVIKEASYYWIHSSAGSYIMTIPAETEDITCCIPSNEHNMCDSSLADSRCSS